VEAHASTGDGTDHKGAIDWLLEQNSKAGSPYYQKLDPKRIAAGGHSQGSISTFAMADDPRLLTTIHVAGGSFDGNGYRTLRRPTAMICGENDTLATPNAEVDYEKSTVPTFFTVMDGVDHIQAARQGLGAIIAWLRWQIGSEPERKSMFIGPNCDFCTGKFKSQSKGF
jgi:alpha/beta superfamily hydrolase